MVKKILFIALILIGIFLRVYHMNSLPQGLFMDEIGMGVDAKNLVQNGTDQYGRHLPFGFEDVSDFKLPGYLYPTALAYSFFGSQIITVRATAMISSILLIFALFYLAKTLFPEKKWLPYFTASIAALSPFAIFMGRIGFETMLATLFLTVFMIAFFKLIQGGKRVAWFLIGTFSILVCNWTYPGPRFIIPIFILLVFAVCFLQASRKTKKNLLVLCGSFIAVCMATFIPSFIVKNLDRRPLSYVTIDTGGTVLQIIVNKYIAVLGSFIWNWNLEFLFDKGDLFAYRAGTQENGIFLGIFVIPYLVGIWYTIKKFSYKNFSLIYLLLFAFVAGIPSALTSHTPYSTRYLPLIIPITIIIALGIDILYQWVIKRGNFVTLLSCIISIAVILYQTAFFAHIYFSHYAKKSLPEFPHAPITMAYYVKDFIKSNPEKQVYFLEDRACRRWSHDDLYLWYFADLPNKPMIAWNNTFRDKRYAQKNMSPFDAYDRITIPSGRVGKILLYPGYTAINTAPSGSLFVRCGSQLPHINQNIETIKEIVYLYPDEKQDPFYVISLKK